VNFWRKTKGAVSIFLVIILVPMLTVSSLFVDASKVALARGVAESAGDLALNTALTDYDTKLKEMYGLFATAQDTEELYAKLEDYYRTCITSAGVTNEDADAYVDQIMVQLGLLAENDATADIMGMELVDFSISKRTDATLANATILEKQIVDFMKYRAPINTGLSFLSSLQSFSTISKQTELVDKRQNYYQAEQTVMENAQQAWTYISRYNKSQFIKSDDYFSTMAKNFGLYETNYQEIAHKVIKDLYDTQNYDTFSPYLYSIDYKEVEVDKNTTKVIPVFYTNKAKTAQKTMYTEYTAFSKENPASASDIRSALVQYYAMYRTMKSAQEALLEYDEGTYGLQYLVQTNRGDLYKAWVTSMALLYDRYSVLRHAATFSGTTESGASVMTVSEAICGEKNEHPYSYYYRKFTDSFDAVAAVFNHELSQYNSTLQGYANQVKANHSTETSGVEGTIAILYGEVTDYRKSISEAKKNLETAVTYLGYVYDGVKKGGTLDAKKAEWSKLADSDDLANTTMAKQDKAEIDSLSTYLNAEDVDKLIKRLNNIIFHLGAMLDQIDSYTFFGTKIVEIDSYATFLYILRTEIGAGKLKTVPTNEAALNKQIDTWCNGKFVVGQAVDVSWENQQGTQARLAGSGTDKLNFYTYLYTHFSGGPVSDDGNISNSDTERTEDYENGEGLYEKVKKKASETAKTGAESADDGNINNGNELNKVSHRPSAADKGSEVPSANVITGDTPADENSPGKTAAGNTAESLSSMFKNLSSAVTDMGTDLRDKLYVSDYILSMFSYDTIEKEYLVTHPGQKEASLQTLTKVPITPDNSYAYGREVEYIVYGGTNAGNLTKAYGSIYGVRLGFNLIYAFSAPSIRDTAFAIAAPISAATLGVIPAPLIQAAIIIGISCCESALDLADLKDGESVPLFKSADTFKCSVGGLVGEVKKEVGENLAEVASDAIDWGTEELNGLLDMTDEQLSAYLESGSEDLINKASESYDTLIARHANTAIQKLTTMCNNAIEENMLNPGTDMVAMVEKGLDDWLADERAMVGKSDLGYIIKEEAVNVIKGQFIQKVLDALTASGNYAQSSVAEAANALTGVINQVRDKITDTISNSCDAVIKQKDEMKQKLSDAANKGADELKKTLTEQIDGVFGGMTANGNVAGSDETGIASMLEFAYSDYLRLFLMIGLYINEEGVLLRTADVIQTNMYVRNGGEGYLLSNAAAYVEISATIQVPPTLMALPLFAAVEGNPVNDQNWYTFDYSSVCGY